MFSDTYIISKIITFSVNFLVTTATTAAGVCGLPQLKNFIAVRRAHVPQRASKLPRGAGV